MKQINIIVGGLGLQLVTRLHQPLIGLRLGSPERCSAEDELVEKMFGPSAFNHIRCPQSVYVMLSFTDVESVEKLDARAEKLFFTL